MSISLCVTNPDAKVKLVPATKIVKNMKGQFNEFKANIDRKYLIYEIFSSMRKEFGYTVEKFSGSNQIILTRTIMGSEQPFMVKIPSENVAMLRRAGQNETKTFVLYDSDSEGELADPKKFEQFVLKQLRIVLRKARRLKKCRMKL